MKMQHPHTAVKSAIPFAQSTRRYKGLPHTWDQKCWELNQKPQKVLEPRIRARAQAPGRIRYKSNQDTSVRELARGHHIQGTEGVFPEEVLDETA